MWLLMNGTMTASVSGVQADRFDCINQAFDQGNSKRFCFNRYVTQVNGVLILDTTPTPV